MDNNDLKMLNKKKREWKKYEEEFSTDIVDKINKRLGFSVEQSQGGTGITMWILIIVFVVCIVVDIASRRGLLGFVFYIFAG